MRVSHFMPFYDVPNKAAFSGAENHLFSLMEGQAKAGLYVELVMIIGLSGDRLKEKACELRKKNIRVTEILYPSQGLGGIKRILRLLILPQLILAICKRRNDILHMHPLTPSGAIMVFVAGFLLCPFIVVSYHNNEPELKHFPYKQILKLMDRFVKRTIVISGSVLDHFINGVGLKENSTKLVYYGIDVPVNEPSKGELRRMFRLPEDRFIVGFVGRLTAQKDIPTLLKALKEIPFAYGVIVGAGELEEELKLLAQKLNLDNVIFTGAVENGAKLMNAFDVFVLPSKFEGLGLVLLEAMIRKVPIIGSKGGAIPEILEEGRLGCLFEVGNVSQLVQAIHQMHENNATKNTYIESGFVRVQEKYTIEAMVNNTSAIYKEVVKT